MKKLGEVNAKLNRQGFPNAYWGERENWYCVLGRTRDSDLVCESNFHVALKRLGGEGEHVAVERASHWACGWVETLLVDEEKRTEAEAILESLSDYPILDETDYSERET